MQRKCVIVWRGGAGSTAGTCCPDPEDQGLPRATLQKMTSSSSDMLSSSVGTLNIQLLKV